MNSAVERAGAGSARIKPARQKLFLLSSLVDFPPRLSDAARRPACPKLLSLFVFPVRVSTGFEFKDGRLSLSAGCTSSRILNGDSLSFLGGISQHTLVHGDGPLCLEMSRRSVAAGVLPPDPRASRHGKLSVSTLCEGATRFRPRCFARVGQASSSRLHFELPTQPKPQRRHCMATSAADKNRKQETSTRDGKKGTGNTGMRGMSASTTPNARRGTNTQTDRYTRPRSEGPAGTTSAGGRGHRRDG